MNLEASNHPALLEAAMHYLSVGIIVIDANAAIIDMNEAAGDFIAQRDCLRVEDGILVSIREDVTERLHDCLRSAYGDLPQKYLMVLPDAEGRSIRIFMTALENHPVPAVALFVWDQRVGKNYLGHLYGLSPREGQVVNLLLRGFSLAEIARQLGVKAESVRAYVKNIFRKTGTNRQSDLIHRMRLDGMLIRQGTSFLLERLESPLRMVPPGDEESDLRDDSPIGGQIIS